MGLIAELKRQMDFFFLNQLCKLVAKTCMIGYLCDKRGGF